MAYTFVLIPKEPNARSRSEETVGITINGEDVKNIRYADDTVLLTRR